MPAVHYIPHIASGGIAGIGFEDGPFCVYLQVRPRKEAVCGERSRSRLTKYTMHANEYTSVWEVRVPVVNSSGDL